MDYTVIVAAPASTAAALQMYAPYSGSAIGQYWMYNGEHALVIFDDLSKQAVAYREISLLLRRPPGREAYPGDVFYLHSRLLERCAKLSDELGGGSLTGLPSSRPRPTTSRPTSPPTSSRSPTGRSSSSPICSTRVSVLRSTPVSRYPGSGGAAQVKAMRKVAGPLRLNLAQFRELEAFAEFGSELDAASLAQLERGARVVEVLKQGQFAPMPVQEQVVSIFAVTEGHMDDVPLEGIRKFEAGLSRVRQDAGTPVCSTRSGTPASFPRTGSLSAINDYKASQGGLVASAEVRQIRRRIKSVESTMKITRAMELIATSRIAKARVRVTENKPYTEKMNDVIRNLGAGSGAVSHPLLERRQLQDGRCCCRQLRPRACRWLQLGHHPDGRAPDQRAAMNEGKEFGLYAVGEKARSYFRLPQFRVAHAWLGVTDTPVYGDARAIGNTLLEDYESERVDSVEVFTTRYVSALTQTPVQWPVLPIEPPEVGRGERPIGGVHLRAVGGRHSGQAAATLSGGHHLRHPPRGVRIRACRPPQSHEGGNRERRRARASPDPGGEPGSTG